MTRVWKWKVTGYYSDSVEAPKIPGELAIETVHANGQSKDLEVQILRQRKDIGRIDIEPLGPQFSVERWDRSTRRRSREKARWTVEAREFRYRSFS